MFKNRLISVLCLLACIIVFTACSEDSEEPSPVAIFVTPGQSSIINVKSGDKCMYNIELHTANNYVCRLEVTSLDKVNGKNTVEDITWTTPQDSYDFVYEAPFINRDSLRITLTFTAWDDAGNKCETKRYVQVVNQEVLMAERTGIVFRAPWTGLPNALCFSAPTKTFNHIDSPDATKADMYMEVGEDFANVVLKSNTSAKFVRYNSYDYAASNAIELQTVYNSSRHDDVISDLRVNDIILVGHAGQAEGVFLVTNIVRAGGADECSVHFSFKGVKSFVGNT